MYIDIVIGEISSYSISRWKLNLYISNDYFYDSYSLYLDSRLFNEEFSSYNYLILIYVYNHISNSTIEKKFCWLNKFMCKLYEIST